jgi:cytochrome c
MKIFPSSVVAIAAPLSVALLSSPAGANDVGKGRSLFERRCTGCHRLDDIRSGPRLRGVVGRAAGSDAGFPYSDALKASRLTWSEATLDRWLADPDALVPDNDMAFRVSEATERAQIIAYLKSVPAR